MVIRCINSSLGFDIVRKTTWLTRKIVYPLADERLQLRGGVEDDLGVVVAGHLEGPGAVGQVH